MNSKVRHMKVCCKHLREYIVHYKNAPVSTIVRGLASFCSINIFVFQTKRSKLCSNAAANNMRGSPSSSCSVSDNIVPLSCW